MFLGERISLSIIERISSVAGARPANGVLFEPPIRWELLLVTHVITSLRPFDVDYRSAFIYEKFYANCTTLSSITSMRGPVFAVPLPKDPVRNPPRCVSRPRVSYVSVACMLPSNEGNSIGSD